MGSSVSAASWRPRSLGPQYGSRRSGMPSQSSRTIHRHFGLSFQMPDSRLPKLGSFSLERHTCFAVWRSWKAFDRVRIRIRPGDRRHEAVASPCDSGHIPGSRLPVLKRPTQGGDMEPQVALIDRDIWPDSRHQPLLADNFAGAFDKNDKNVERSSTQMNLAARPLKISVRWEQAKWTERNKVRSRSGLFVSHPLSLNIFGRRFASQRSSLQSAGPAAQMRRRYTIRPLLTLSLPSMFSILCGGVSARCPSGYRQRLNWKHNPVVWSGDLQMPL